MRGGLGLGVPRPHVRRRPCGVCGGLNASIGTRCASKHVQDIVPHCRRHSHFVAHVRIEPEVRVQPGSVVQLPCGPTSLTTGSASSPHVKPTVPYRRVRLSGLLPKEGKISPHTLRHTAATWLMQRHAIRGRSQAFSECRSRCCSTPSAIIIPDCMREAAAAITSRDRKQNVSVVETVVHLEKHLAREP